MHLRAFRTFPALAVALMATAAVLAGCTGSETDDVTGDGPPVLAAGRGAIDGLLIDDVYRPIAGGVVLLQELGLTATTNQDGEFTFLDIMPGSYLVRVTAAGHEAAPANVDVSVGVYTDLELTARRIFSDDGRTVTSEYSVFIPCAIDYVANGNVLDCTGDQSGDSFRAGYTSDYTPYNATATYLIVEMKANKPGRYEVQLREDDGSSGGGDRYAVAQFDGDYLRVQFKVGEANTEHNGQGNNVPLNLTKPVMLILFADSQGREELQGAGLPVCCGVGAHFGIKAKFIQTLFIGEIQEGVDVDHYCVLSTGC